MENEREKDYIYLENDSIYEMFFTYEGLIRLCAVQDQKNAEHFQDCATRRYYSLIRWGWEKIMIE
jgi:hypothetical protein